MSYKNKEKYEVFPAPGGEDVLLKIADSLSRETYRIIMTRSELHQLDWAIRKYLEKQPLRIVKEAAGGRR